MTDSSNQDANGKVGNQAHQDSSIARLVCLMVSVTALVCLAFGVWWIFASLDSGSLLELVERHGPALVGVPAAVCLATAVTCAARAIDGNMDFDFLGVRAQGGTATGGLWLAVFLAVALSVRWLW